MFILLFYYLFEAHFQGIFKYIISMFLSSMHRVLRLIKLNKNAPNEYLNTPVACFLKAHILGRVNFRPNILNQNDICFENVESTQILKMASDKFLIGGKYFYYIRTKYLCSEIFSVDHKCVWCLFQNLCTLHILKIYNILIEDVGSKIYPSQEVWYDMDISS